MRTSASTMLAAVVDAPTHARIQRVPKPVPGEGSVRVRLEGCGVCGSNLPAWEGRSWFQYPLAPGELGHEGWGYVDALGPKANRFQVGDRVAMLSYRAYAEHDIADEKNVVRLPASLNHAPFPGEPLGCAMNIFRRCDIKAGQTVAIIGIGFLGALLTQLAARAGARVIAISRRPFALERARDCGAAEVLQLTDSKSSLDPVRQLTNGLGCERVIEAVGCQETLDLAGEMTRERGRLIIAGYHQDGSRRVDLQLWNWRGLDVINAHERDSKVYLEGMQAALDAMQQGTWNPVPLYTHTFPLGQIASAFNAMRHRPDNFLKAIISL